MQDHQQQRIAQHTLTATEKEEAHETAVEANQAETDEGVIFVDSYVLVVDPNTGELVLEAEAGSRTSASPDNTAVERLRADATAADFVRVLENAIDAALKKVPAAGQAQSQDGQALGDGQQQPNVQEQRTQGMKPLRGKGKSQETLSRFDKAGAHNHKSIAEQFLNGQLKHKRKDREEQQVQPGGVVQPPALNRQLGTAQHRNLKKAFEMIWDEEDDAQKGRAQDEL